MMTGEAELQACRVKSSIAAAAKIGDIPTTRKIRSLLILIENGARQTFFPGRSSVGPRNRWVLARLGIKVAEWGLLISSAYY